MTLQPFEEGQIVYVETMACHGTCKIELIDHKRKFKFDERALSLLSDASAVTCFDGCSTCTQESPNRIYLGGLMQLYRRVRSSTNSYSRAIPLVRRITLHRWGFLFEDYSDKVMPLFDYFFAFSDWIKYGDWTFSDLDYTRLLNLLSLPKVYETASRVLSVAPFHQALSKQKDITIRFISETLCVAKFSNASLCYYFSGESLAFFMLIPRLVPKVLSAAKIYPSLYRRFLVFLERAKLNDSKLLEALIEV